MAALNEPFTLRKQMIVYANRLLLTPSAPDPHDHAVKSVAIWLSHKVRRPVEEIRLVNGTQYTFRGSQKVEFWSTYPEFEDVPVVSALRYTHPDQVVSGRMWSTEVGFRRKRTAEPIEVSVLLQTNEISTQVTASVETSRPGLVDQIEEDCQLAEETPGLSITIIEADAVESFLNIVDDPKRQHAIVLVSPDPFTEAPLVDVELLRSQLLGLANVYVVQNKYDTFAVTQVLGRSRSAWNGAINIIFPRRSEHSRYIPTKLISPTDISDLKNVRLSVERRILELITHRFNLPNSWRHVSPQVVRRMRLERRVAQLHAKSRSDSPLETLLELAFEEHDQHTSQISNLEILVLEREDELERIRDENRRLKFQLSRKRTELEPADSDLSPRFFSSLDEVTSAVDSELGAQVHLTNRARKALRESPYRDPAMVFDAFQLLATVLHKMFTGHVTRELVDQALQESGVEYATHMSDTTMGKYPGYDASYKGRAADLNRHLKLGTSRNPARCFRIHFEWDEEDQVFVIHHAGRHLETTQS